MLQLVLPSIEYKESYLEAVVELRGVEKKKREIEKSIIEQSEKRSADFAELVKILRGRAEGKYLPEGYVPNTYFWLVDGERFIGWLDIRHSLTEHLREIGGHIGYAIRPSERGKGYGNKILELALPKAQELGIKDVRITCDADNTPSAKIIEKNGGVFENIKTTSDGVPKRRYWINLK